MDNRLLPRPDPPRQMGAVVRVPPKVGQFPEAKQLTNDPGEMVSAIIGAGSLHKAETSILVPA